MTSQGHSIDDSAELATLYLAGAMTDEERAAFEAHLAEGCPQCDQEMLALDPLFAALGAADEPVVPSAAARIAALARANESLGELSPQQVAGVAALVAEVEKSLPEVLDAARNWRPVAELEGIVLQRLGYDRDDRRITALVHMTPGSVLPAHTHAEGEQCVVLHGELSIGEERLSAGEYRYWKPGESQPQQVAEHGCLLLISSPLD
ncbi:MAG TPA: cupin domain-containing protein [Pirellulales bacterium]